MAKLKPIVCIPMHHASFAVRLSQIMHEAHSIGLYETGHAIREAVKKCGWEIEYVNTRSEGKPL